MKPKIHLPKQLPIYGCIAALFLSLAPLQAAKLYYLPEGKPNVMALLPPPPAMDSPEQAADMQEVRLVSRSASSQDVALANSQSKFSIFTFTPEIGLFFQPGRFLKTEALFRRVQKDAETVTDNAKMDWRRPRPYTLDPGLAKGKGKMKKTFSYPSGHSTESMVLALVLADLFPQHRDAILAEARSIGWHRVEIARHYPTDIYAGRVLAQAIVHQMKKDKNFQRDFAAAQAEVAAASVAQ